MAFKKRDKSPIYTTKAHRDARARLLRMFRPGDPCCLCGHPMWPDAAGKTSHLHADHVPGTDAYRGLAHGTRPCQDCGKRCNVVDGARRGRARQSGARQGDGDRVTRLRW